ncbi:MAG: agmatinase family protein [Bdellovibrionota bacterium]
MFDPNAPAAPNSGIFGLPYSEQDAKLVFIPVPWEATTSYLGGTSSGPSAILQASKQVDLYDIDVPRSYEPGMHMLSTSNVIQELDLETRRCSETDVDRVNELCAKLNRCVYAETKKQLSARKLVGIVGGDHSVPFGAIEAASELHKSFGILHLDAHADLRKAFEGYTWSHASIMYNVIEWIPAVIKLVQAGVRDFCEDEIEYIHGQSNKITTFFDRDVVRACYGGSTWKNIASDIISHLPEKVWVSFDIDALNPHLCPHTGTPVPGGLEFNQAMFLVSELVRSGRKIIGFDLCEVAPNSTDKNDEWDANVGARVLYQLSAWMFASQGLVKPRALK